MEQGDINQLSTADAQGRRLWVYPADVSGRFRRRRDAISGGLLLVFLALPWVKIQGAPALLIDVVHGRFSVLGFRFWAHDAPMLLFVAGGAAVLLAFVTSVWGRLWCGWACPQTVFVDQVFRRVERWIEGDAVRRRQLDAAPWSPGKLLKKGAKWSLYLGISLVLSHSFLAYFIGAEALGGMMAQAPSKNAGSFIAMAGISLAVLFDFGWFRERFCTLICPYGRFQSVLMDEKSLAVSYDVARGEPRRGVAPQPAQAAGDCISCRRCVQVCPTGIDIRNGLQLECIACTACIDACDAVMAKIGKPPGLIRYSSERKAGWQGWARPAAYLAVLGALAGGLTWILSSREPVQALLIRAVGAPYDEVVRPGLGKEVVNRFKVDLLNQAFEPVRVQIAAPSEPATLGAQLVSPSFPLTLEPGEAKRVDLFVRFPLSRVQEGRGRLELELAFSSPHWKDPRVSRQEVPLVGPLR
jgi:cytochrome c oxidase accessory protein FixG